MSSKENWFNETIAKAIIESGIDIEKTEKLEEIIHSTIMNSLPRNSEILLNALKEDSAGMLEEHRCFRQEFESRLLRRWRKPINLLETLIVISVETGEQLSDEYRQEAISKNDYIFEALIRNHSRACQVAYEILCLLKGGFADGAVARWRTLHELSVLSNFVSEHNNQTAKRYLDYEVIENYYEMLEYQKQCNKLKHEPLSEGELDKLNTERCRLISEYGKDFDKQFGWVADVLPEEKRNFKGLEDETQLNHLRPYYKFACNSVHLGPKGSNYSLGLRKRFRSGNLLLCGASNYGLSVPGQNTSISLTQITASLVTVNTNYERLMILNSMLKLNDEICNSFVSTQKQIDKEEIEKKLLAYRPSPNKTFPLRGLRPHPTR